MKTKHREGEWRVKKHPHISRDKPKMEISVVTETFTVCGLSYLKENEYSKNRVLSDAKLIASSPVMRYDLDDLIWLVDNGATHEELIERIKTIKKATI